MAALTLSAQSVGTALFFPAFREIADAGSGNIGTTLKMRFLLEGREMDAKQAGRNFAPFNSLSPVCGEAVC